MTPKGSLSQSPMILRCLSSYPFSFVSEGDDDLDLLTLSKIETSILDRIEVIVAVA